MLTRYLIIGFTVSGATLWLWWRVVSHIRAWAPDHYWWRL